MKTLDMHLDVRKTVLAAILLVALAVIGLHARSFAAAGACTAPATDYGTVTSNVTISGTGTYRVWTRIAAPDSTNNTIKLDIDSTSCYTIGGSTVPVFTGTQDTNGNRFASAGTNWFAKDTTGTFIDVSLTSGSHVFKIYGNAPGVVVDRIVLTQDTSCNPTGVGDNCASPPDTTNPTVTFTAPANGATGVATQPTLTATAADDVAVQKVDFYVDGAKVGSDTSASYSYTLSAGQALASGSHTAYAIATDTAGNTAQSTTSTFTVADATPPVISAVVSGSVSQTGATITWTTNEAADSQVKYGTTTSYGSQTTVADTTPRVTSHSVTLSGLTAGTTYHYQVFSKDASSNSANSVDATFTTQSAGGDTTAPTISITAPTSGATVKGKMNVTVNANDNVGVVGVQFKLDGSNIGAEKTTSPFTLSWTPAVYTGSHTITAVARDAAGNTKTATTITFTINVASADIDVSGTVDYLDLSALAGNYGKTGGAITIPRADIVNSDGLNTVNYLDLSALASKYGT